MATGRRIAVLTNSILTYGILTVASIFAVFSTYWMLITSLKPDREVYSLNPSLLPEHITFLNYDFALSWGYLRQLSNSLIISSGTTALSLIITVFGAYGLSRFRFRGRKILSRTILATYVIPSSLLVIPFVFVIISLGLYNTFSGVILANVTFTLPFTVWTMAGYLASIPIDLEEAAMIDGCSRIEALFRVVLPLSLPGVIAIATFSFVNAWNEYLYVVALIDSETKFTLPLGLASLLTSDIVPWGKLMGMSVLYSVPGILFFLFLQKYMVQGLVKGAVKA
nr:carbohydrate ABC transporter permease [Candidatus Njordarchaeum guaymaensis]